MKAPSFQKQINYLRFDPTKDAAAADLKEPSTAEEYGAKHVYGGCQN